MINKKSYYSISEVSKMLNIQEHTIRFWDSKLPGLSKQSQKGKSRFFSQQQINKLININNLLKNNDTLNLAYQIVTKNKLLKTNSDSQYPRAPDHESSVNLIKITKIKSIIKDLKKLIHTR